MIGAAFHHIQIVNQQGPQLNMHLASFSFSALASVRGCPENDVVSLLTDEILMDGFVSQGEPILVTQPADLVADVEDGVDGI